MLIGVLLIGLLVAGSFLPGFYFVRKLRWGPIEKVCGAIGLSLIALYAVSAAFYGLDIRGPVAFWLVSAVCLGMGIRARHDILRLLSTRQAQHVLAAFACLLLWTLALLGMIRNYSGGGWSGDWVEHFQRTLYLLHHFPKDTPIFGGYQFTSRPPMMNLLAAFFLRQTGDRFELFQITAAFLNLLVFFPCCLLAPALWRHSRRRVWLLAALFALNPLVAENTTYPWTKLLTAFYVVLGVWFYLAGWRKRDRLRMTAAFVALAAGMLVHYSAGPYLVFLALHYLVVVFRSRPQRWRELATAAGVGGALLATWFVWSIAVYGARSTFSSNSSVTDFKKSEGTNSSKIAANIFDTVVPYPLRSDVSLMLLDQPSQAGWLRDSAFLLYQCNVIFAMGVIGGPMVLYLLFVVWRRRKSQEQIFWLMLVPFCLVLGVAVHGDRDTVGLTQVTLQPLVVLGLTLLAAGFASLRRVLVGLLLAGCMVDFALGVFLQARIENAKNSPDQAAFADQPTGLSRYAWLNWFEKHPFAASDAAQSPQRPASDLPYLGDWYARNHGQMTFLGDWWGDWTAGPVLLMFIVWLAVLFGHWPFKTKESRVYNWFHLRL